MAFKLGMTVDMLVLMSMTLTQGHSCLAEEQFSFELKEKCVCPPQTIFRKLLSWSHHKTWHSNWLRHDNASRVNYIDFDLHSRPHRSNHENNSSVHFSSRWYQCAREGPYMRSIPSLRSFPNVAFEIVSMLVWMTMSISRPLKGDRWALPLSTPLSSRRSMVWCDIGCSMLTFST